MTPPGDKSPFVFARCWCFVRQEPGQGCGGAEPGVGDPSTAPRPVQGPAVLGTGCRALWLASPKHLRVPPSCPGHGCHRLGPQGLEKCQQPSGEGLTS